MVLCLSGGPTLPPRTPSVAIAWWFQAVSTFNPGPLPGFDHQSLSFVIQPPSKQTGVISVWGVQDDGIDPLCSLISAQPHTNYSCSLLLGFRSPSPSRLIPQLVKRLPYYGRFPKREDRNLVVQWLRLYPLTTVFLSLLRELRSHMPHGTAKKKNK